MCCKRMPLICCGLALLVGCEKKPATVGGSGGGSAPGSAVVAEKRAEKLLDLKDDSESSQFRSTPMAKILGDNFEARPEEYAEARAWLKEPKNRPAKLPHEAVAKLVEELYAAGAEKVYASGLSPLDDGGTKSGSLTVLVSATDDAPRYRVLEIRNKHYAAYLPTVGKVDLVEPLSRSEVGLAAVIIELQH